ncbi:hypothetical protein [Methylovulum miyakonense]|uniref:hypothetical protein n=1 Tax=Methylovulum miyakonense TaxID=645578 RepID=UPI00035D1C56|nr:hypothetical protein [Methylovulum miyakonense]
MKLNESLKDRLAIVLIILFLPILIPLLYLTPWIKKIWPLFKSLVFFVWWAIQGLSISAFGLIFLQSFLKEQDIELLGFTLMLFLSMGYAIIKLVRYIKFNKRWATKKKELPLILLDKLRSGISLAELYSSTIYSDEFRNSYEYSYPHLVVEVLVDELSRLDDLKLDLNISEEWQNKSFDQEWYDKVSNELRKIGKINEEIKDSKNKR